MGELIDDKVLDAFAVTGTPAEAARKIHDRYRDIYTTLGVSPESGTDPKLALEVLTELKALG
jgi:hypothetical protein